MPELSPTEHWLDDTVVVLINHQPEKQTLVRPEDYTKEHAMYLSYLKSAQNWGLSTTAAQNLQTCPTERRSLKLNCKQHHQWQLENFWSFEFIWFWRFLAHTDYHTAKITKHWIRNTWLLEMQTNLDIDAAQKTNWKRRISLKKIFLVKNEKLAVHLNNL